MSVKQRLIRFVEYKQMSNREFCLSIDVSAGYINSISKSIQPDKLSRISALYPELNTTWLLTGEGDMLKNPVNKLQVNETHEANYKLVPLLPILAKGGRLDDFSDAITINDCEMLVSPIKDVDFAITVSGDSMAPEYPSGSKILIKKINNKSFIEWGRCYVLDTCNGTVIKKIGAPDDLIEEIGLDYVVCRSVNKDPMYSPFKIPLKDIYGIYRVLMMLTEK